jgi:uncharacterized GH25 family protein
MIRIAACAILLATVSPAAAHDFWIAASSFRVAPHTSVSLRFLIGEPGKVEHWGTDWRKIVSLQDFGPGGVRDLLGGLTIDGAADAMAELTEPGTHIIAFTSNHALSDLDAKAFNTYAEHEGLALVIATRRQAGKTEARGRELYARRAKALIQVGGTATDTVSRPIGQTLEIVPETNPYLLRPGEPLRARILFHGAPLAGASVVLESLAADAKHGTPVLSDKDGRVSFPNPGTGSWKLNTVWSYPIVDPRAEFETIFCSLTFGH